VTYKVGDRVRIVEGPHESDHYRRYIGKTGIVINNGYNPKPGNVNVEYDEQGWDEYPIKCLELIKLRTVFKVGDRVKAKAYDRLGTIRHIASQSAYVDVQFDDTTKLQSVLASALDKVESMYPFKIGMLVKIVKKHDESLWASPDMDRTVGKKGKILDVDTEDNAINVEIEDEDESWWYRPESLQELAIAQASKPIDFSTIVLKVGDEVEVKRGAEYREGMRGKITSVNPPTGQLYVQFEMDKVGAWFRPEHLTPLIRLTTVNDALTVGCKVEVTNGSFKGTRGFVQSIREDTQQVLVSYDYGNRQGWFGSHYLKRVPGLTGKKATGIIVDDLGSLPQISDDMVDALAFGTAFHRRAEEAMRARTHTWYDYQWPKHLRDVLANTPTPRYHLNTILGMDLSQIEERVFQTLLLKGAKPVNPIKIETKVFIDGTEAKAYNDDHLFQKIQDAENEIKRLDAIETKPASLQARIESLKAGVAALVEFMDKRDRGDAVKPTA
jgi:transcription antitermination factor NusG